MAAFVTPTSTPGVETTFKARVDRFWLWFARVAPRLARTLASGHADQISREVDAATEVLGPRFSWMFGSGPENGRYGPGHSLTLSGEGDPDRQLLAQYWRDQSPKIPGWTFYPARQPRRIEGIALQMGGREFLPEEFWVTPVLDTRERRIDVEAWHPLFEVIEVARRPTVLGLFLDEVLGEYGRRQWIGQVRTASARPADAIPLEELPRFVGRITAQTGWQRRPPGEENTPYRLNDPHDRFPRGDIIAGSTVHPGLVEAYAASGGRMPDPLAGMGAEYAYVAFEKDVLPRGKEVAARGEIEVLLNAALREAASGRVLGGALGTRMVYIDVLLFDGLASRNLVGNTLRQRRLPVATAIHPFTRTGKR